MRLMAICSAIAVALPVSALATQVSAASAAKLDRNDPNYVRCERAAPVGSLIKSKKTCLTNAAWAKLAQETQGRATRFQRAHQRGGTGVF